MSNSNVRIRVWNDPSWGCNAVHILQDLPGTPNRVRVLVLQDEPDGEDSAWYAWEERGVEAMLGTPVFRLGGRPEAGLTGHDDTQALMDELWNMGIRPSQPQPSLDGQVEATKLHISDLRRLVFDPPKHLRRE